MQQAFNTIVAHLREQGVQAMDDMGNRCMYRGKEGRMCALGVLIPDSLYDEGMEGMGIVCLDDSDIGKGLYDYLHEKYDGGQDLIDMLTAMQEVHDDFSRAEGSEAPPMKRWEEGFKAVAERFDLTIPNG